MRKVIDTSIILLVLLFYIGCNSDGDNHPFHSDIRDPDISDSLFSLLVDDAKLITQEYLFEQDLPEKNSIELPNQYVSPVLVALQKIYGDSEYEISKFNIHAFCRNQLYEVLLQSDPQSALVQQWLNGEATNNEALDNLINSYKLKLKALGTKSNYFIVESNQGLNMEALSERLNKIDGLSMAAPNLCAGDGTRIKLLEFDFSYLDLEFSYGWGDCPAGCIYRHYWHMRIFSNGKIELLKEMGDQLP